MAAVLSLWIAAIFLGYYVTHRPWANARGLTPIWAAADLLSASLLTVLAGGMGRRILGPMAALAPLERLSVQAAAGLGVMALTLLGLGLSVGLHPAILWGLTIAGWSVFWRQSTAWLREWRSLPEVYRQLPPLGRAACCFLAFALALELLQALAPPLAWDALVYHLELPRQYLSAGRIVFVESNLFVGFPQLAEMLYTWAMALRSGQTAAVLGWIVGLLALLGTAGAAIRLYGPSVGWVAPAALLTGASFLRAMGWAYVDLWGMLFGAGLLICLEQHARSREPGWLIRAGAMAGLACGTKYTAAVLLPISLAWIVMNHLQAKPASGHRNVVTSWKPLLADLARFVVPALLLATVWLFKNLLMTGNPLYPFLFDGRGVDSLRQAFHTGTTPARSILSDLILPLELTVQGVEGGFGFAASIGPLLIGLIPGLLAGWTPLDERQRNSILRLLMMALVLWLIWAVAAHVAGKLLQARLYYSAFPTLALVASGGFLAIEQFEALGGVLRKFFRLAVLFSVVLTSLEGFLFFVSRNPLPVLTGTQEESDFLAQELGWYGPAMQAIAELPSEATVLLLWEPRSYYCRRECRADVILDNWWSLRRTVGDSAAIGRKLRARGITHVLIYETGITLEREAQPLFQPSDWSELAVFRATELQPLQEFVDIYTLYTLAPAHE